MSGLELNKIAAAILLASLIAMLVGFFANILYKPKLTADERGYQIEVTEGTNATDSTAAKPEPINIEELMANASVENGAKIIKKCISCHSFDKGGANKIGPNLWNIVNSPIGQKQGFTYSKTFQKAEGVWSIDRLFEYLKSPGRYMPGTKMSFAGLRKPKDIADVVAYLKEKGN